MSLGDFHNSNTLAAWSCCVIFRMFIEEKLGRKYVESRSMEFSKSYEETGPATPVFFILSAGVNPVKDVQVQSYSS